MDRVNAAVMYRAYETNMHRDQALLVTHRRACVF